MDVLTSMPYKQPRELYPMRARHKRRETYPYIFNHAKANYWVLFFKQIQLRRALFGTDQGQDKQQRS